MELGSFHGLINDADSHLMVRAREYPDILGEAGKILATRLGAGTPLAAFFDPEYGEQVTATQENVWKVKGVVAPGAGDVEVRLRVLDIMGIRRQLIFPQVFVWMLISSHREHSEEVVSRYNDFALQWTKDGGGRLRPAAILDLRDIDAACKEAKRVISGGIRAVLIQDGVAPGGVSPADPSMDRFWATLAEAEVPALLHIGGGLGFMGSGAWGRTDLLSSGGFGIGEDVTPYVLATVHMSAENYLQTLVLGGVFERHPTLRFGVIELGASWVGPMAERMDWIRDCGPSEAIRTQLSLRPSEYLRRNVRVTPFITEDIGLMVERYGLGEVYVFSTDFPHPEGGRDPLDKMASSVSRHGPEAVERLLITNAEWLLPTPP
ncbi:MAG: amidohydrolase family protein [Deltaproteobacteria bacterium]